MTRNRAYRKTLKMQGKIEKRRLKENINRVKRRLKDAIKYGKTHVTWDKWPDDDRELSYDETVKYFKPYGYTVMDKSLCDQYERIKLSWGDDND